MKFLLLRSKFLAWLSEAESLSETAEAMVRKGLLENVTKHDKFSLFIDGRGGKCLAWFSLLSCFSFSQTSEGGEIESKALLNLKVSWKASFLSKSPENLWWKAPEKACGVSVFHRKMAQRAMKIPQLFMQIEASKLSFRHINHRECVERTTKGCFAISMWFMWFRSRALKIWLSAMKCKIVKNFILRLCRLCFN